MKINYEELMQYYEVADNREPSDDEYEDAVDAIVCRVPFIVKEHKELETENKTLREQIQSRQELVEQYEQDIIRLRQKIRELEQQKNWLAKKCEDLSDDVEDFFMPYNIPAETWIERAEQATKEKNETGY